MTEFLLKYATFWSVFFNFLRSNFFFALKKLKKPPQKVAYLSRNSVVSEIFHLLPTYCPTAQMAEFMFQNVAYRATVYRTGAPTKKRGAKHAGFPSSSYTMTEI